MSQSPAQFDNVSVVTKANVFFEGKVVSHAILFGDGSKKSIGLIYPGSYHFGTGVPERMEIIAGICKVRLDGESEWKDYTNGTFFDVPEHSGFDISVEDGITEYVCSFG